MNDYFQIYNAESNLLNQYENVQKKVVYNLRDRNKSIQMQSALINMDAIDI